MHKPPFLFVFTSLMSIILPSFIQDVHAQESAQELTIDINQKVFVIGDELVLSGKSIPSDALIVELFNPTGKLVLRTQMDVGEDGSFSVKLREWSVPTKDFPFGSYSLVVKSSIDEERRRATEALMFQPIHGLPEEAELVLGTVVSVPAVIGKDEVARVLVQVTINGVLVKGDATETLEDSHIHFPDGSIRNIGDFGTLEDGIYFTDFSSSMLGHHTIHVQAFLQGLIANSVSDVLVLDGPVLLLGNEIAELNSNINNLRKETESKTVELSEEVAKISSAAGQVTSLLLPIIGMIAIIVALQATILARRGKPSDAVKHET